MTELAIFVLHAVRTILEVIIVTALAATALVGPLEVLSRYHGGSFIRDLFRGHLDGSQ